MHSSRNTAIDQLGSVAVLRHPSHLLTISNNTCFLWRDARLSLFQLAYALKSVVDYLYKVIGAHKAPESQNTNQLPKGCQS